MERTEKKTDQKNSDKPHLKSREEIVVTTEDSYYENSKPLVIEAKTFSFNYPPEIKQVILEEGDREYGIGKLYGLDKKEKKRRTEFYQNLIEFYREITNDRFPSHFTASHRLDVRKHTRFGGEREERFDEKIEGAYLNTDLPYNFWDREDSIIYILGSDAPKFVPILEQRLFLEPARHLTHYRKRLEDEMTKSSSPDANFIISKEFENLVGNHVDQKNDSFQFLKEKLNVYRELKRKKESGQDISFDEFKRISKVYMSHGADPGWHRVDVVSNLQEGEGRFNNPVYRKVAECDKIHQAIYGSGEHSDNYAFALMLGVPAIHGIEENAAVTLHFANWLYDGPLFAEVAECCINPKKEEITFFKRMENLKRE